MTKRWINHVEYVSPDLFSSILLCSAYWFQKIFCWTFLWKINLIKNDWHSKWHCLSGVYYYYWMNWENENKFKSDAVSCRGKQSRRAHNSIYNLYFIRINSFVIHFACVIMESKCSVQYFGNMRRNMIIALNTEKRGDRIYDSNEFLFSTKRVH